MNKKNFWPFFIFAIILIVMAAIEHFQGRLTYCACGYIKVWHGIVNDSGDSQHLFDWYSFTHVLHGVLFYFGLWLIDRKKKLTLTTKFLIAIGLAAGWEILENSSYIIDRYRTATFSLNYYGDTVINSVGDVISAAIGFFITSRVRWWMSLILFIAIETMLALVIRDNLTINIIMLIHPIEAIKTWQQGL